MTPAELAELQFFPTLFGSILDDGVGDRSDPNALRCAALLQAARAAPGISVAKNVRNPASGLLMHATALFRAPYVAQETPVALAAVIGDRMMREILASGYLVLHVGSDFDQAMGLIRAGLSDVVDDEMRARAEDEWVGALERVRRSGLFDGISVVEAGPRAEMARAA